MSTPARGRRELFRRSKAGCWNCRSKKKKCDEARPHCTRCARNGEGCRYPSEASKTPDAADVSNSHHQEAGPSFTSPSLPSSSSRDFSHHSVLQPSPSLVRSHSSTGFAYANTQSMQHRSPYHPYPSSQQAPRHPQSHQASPPHYGQLKASPHTPSQSQAQAHARSRLPSQSHQPVQQSRQASQSGPYAQVQPPLLPSPRTQPRYAHAYGPGANGPTAGSDWDEHQHPQQQQQQQPLKRTKYDDHSSSASSTASSPVYTDPFARRSFGTHERLASNSSFEGRTRPRDALPPISGFSAPQSQPMSVSVSLPPLSAWPRAADPSSSSPNMSYCSTDTSPVSHSVRTFTDSTVMTSTTSVDRDGPAASTSSAPTKKGLPCPNAVSPNSYLAMFAPLPPVPGQDASSARGGPEQPPLPPGYEPTPSWAAIKALEPDQLALNPDPHQLLQSSYEFVSSTASTQCTNGYRAFMRLLHEIAKLEQGQAMAHALAAVTATHQANFAKAFTPATEAEGTSPVNLSARPGTPASGVRSPGSDALRQQTPSGAGNASGSTPGLSGESSHRSSMLDLADRHHVAAIKALQQQHTPNRRRRFSIIDAPTSAGSDLPIGSNAGVMLLLIMACNQAGKSLMLPSYFNQCEEFLADAVEHISSHRMFPSITGEAYGGTPDDPPVFVPQNLNNYGHLLVVSTFVGIFQSYLAQYAAVTDWDYNPSRLRRLQPYDWAEKDADIWTSTRCSAAETTYSISMLTLELVVETLDKVRKFRRAEQAAYGNRQSSRSEAESSVAALESLALRGEIDLLIKNLESGSLWQGAIRILSPDDEDEVFAYLDALSSDEPVSAITQSGGNYVKAESPSRFSPVLTNTSTSTSPEPRSSALATDAAAVREGSPSSKMNVSSTGSLKSGSLFIPSSTGTGKQVNRIRLGNHLYRSALMVDLYLSVFNLAPSTQVIRNLVSRAIRLLEAVPMLHEMGLIWPVLVLGSHAQGVEREQVRVFLKRSQWKGSAGPGTAAEVLERVWSGQVSDWRAGVNYFGKPFMT